MKSIEIGKSAVVASQAALGVMRMDALDADAAAEVVRTAAELGVNFFDTADIYGFNVNHDHASSRVLGRAWKDAGLKREDIFLQTKFGINIEVIIFDTILEGVLEKVINFSGFKTSKGNIEAPHHATRRGTGSARH